MAERAGTKVGGVVAGFPSAIVVALFFIGWTQSAQSASDATTLVPIVMGIATLFSVVFVFLYPIHFYVAVAAGLGLWFVLSLTLIIVAFDSFFYSIWGLVLLYCSSFLLMEKVLKIRSVGRKSVNYTVIHILFRGIFSGGIIALAVAVAKAGGPIVGGVFASFPAVMLSAMVINHFTHGREFASAFAKTMASSGPLNATIYAISVRYFYPMAGLVLGTVMALIVSLVAGLVIYRFLSRNMS